MQPNGNGQPRMRQVARQAVAVHVIVSRALFERDPAMVRVMQASQAEHVLIFHMQAVETIRWEWELIRAGWRIGDSDQLAVEDLILLRANSVQQVEISGPQLVIPGAM